MAEDNRRQLSEFRTSLLDDVALNAASNMTNDMEEFLTIVTNQLIAAEEIDDFIYVPYEGINQKKRKLQVDGYSYNELDDCLCLFIGIPLSYEDEEVVLTTPEAKKWIARVTAFLDNSEYVLMHAEESAPGFGLAYDVVHRYGTVQRYKIYLITDQFANKNLSEIQESAVGGIPVECHIWDINRLYELSRSASGKEEIVINFKDLGMDGIPCLPSSKTDDYHAYLCNIPGMVLATLYNKYGSKLLEGNVRSFLQVRGKVNKGIRATILNEPSMFFAYNNGIAATAYDVKTEMIHGILHITEITSLQIVNGGQTTASLATALIKDKKDHAEENILKINVPMKLSIVTPEKADKLIANIARYANSQNKVSDADLWSNHPFHIRMEDFSRRILAPATGGRQYGTHWYYERANGQYKQETYKCTPKEKEKFEQRNPQSQMFTKTELAKFMHIYQMRPDIASAGGQKAFAKFAEWASKEWEKNDTNFNEEYFRTVAAMAILFRQSDKLVRKQSWYRSYKANIVAYAISKILYTVKTDYPEKSISFKNIWQKQSLSAAWIHQIEDAAYVMYQHLIDEKRDIENVTEWAKRERCWEAAKKLPYSLQPAFIAELQSQYEANEDKKNARSDQKLANQLNVLVEVVEYGQDGGWTELLSWLQNHPVVSPSEKNMIKLAQKMDGGLITSERQCAKLLKILEKCRTEGYPK